MDFMLERFFMGGLPMYPTWFTDKNIVALRHLTNEDFAASFIDEPVDRGYQSISHWGLYKC